MLRILLSLTLLFSIITACSGGGESDGFLFGSSCAECGESTDDGEYCEAHSCPECKSFKNESDFYCEEHACEQCGEIKDIYDRYCEMHKCEECGDLKESDAAYCEAHLCPNCGELKNEYDDYCSDCIWDEDDF